jgi:hypothetical protein
MNATNEDGSTLVEVLVAFVILAGAVVLSFQIFADGIRRLTGVETRIQEVNVKSADESVANKSFAPRPFKVEIDIVDEKEKSSERLIIETIILSRPASS